VAGLVLTALLVPQGMAYAQLAGLPPATGLYTSIVCLIAYALVGPSRVLVLGPDSSLGPLIAATVLPLVAAGGDPGRAVALASALAILTGTFMLVAGFGRLGFVADLLSRPTILGYVNGLALVIVVSQIPKLLGFTVDADGLPATAGAVVDGIAAGDVVPAAAAVGIVSLFVLLVVPRVLPRVPAVLLAVIAAAAVSAAADLAERGVAVVGPLPEGLPPFDLPAVSGADVALLVAGAAGIALVALADTISTATAFAEGSGEEVDGDREMIGIGAANIAVGFFQGFAVSTSASRTAVAQQAGARTQLTGLVGAALIAVLLVGVPGALTDLPQATLAAIVIAAAFSLADVRGARRLLRQRPTEFTLAVAAFLGVALLGVLQGILIAILLSVGNVFRRLWMPYRTTLGRPRGVPGLHDVTRYPDAVVDPRCPVFRFDAPLIFANARTFRDEVRRMAAAPDRPEWIVVAAEPITDVDTTACDMLEDLVPALDAGGTRLVFAELKDPVRAKIDAFGLRRVLGDDRFFPTIKSALRAHNTDG
jgi:high affinity sulfate transporter 1